MEAKIITVLPVLAIDLCVGLIGFILALGWWRVSGRGTDRDTIIFLAKIFGGIALFGMVLAFVM
jgi:hypothetical protein